MKNLGTVISFGVLSASALCTQAGALDEAALWYRALSADEMKQVYDVGLAAIPEPTVAILLLLGLPLLLLRRRG